MLRKYFINFKFFLLFTLLIFNQFLVAGDQYSEEPTPPPVTGGSMRTSEDGTTTHTIVCSSTAEEPEDVFDDGVVPPDSAYFSPRQPRSHPLWRSRSEGSPPLVKSEPEMDALRALLATTIADPRIVFAGLAPLQQQAILKAYGTIQTAISNHLYWDSLLRNGECA